MKTSIFRETESFYIITLKMIIRKILKYVVVKIYAAEILKKVVSVIYRRVIFILQ